MKESLKQFNENYHRTEVLKYGFVIYLENEEKDYYCYYSISDICAINQILNENKQSFDITETDEEYNSEIIKLN